MKVKQASWYLACSRGPHPAWVILFCLLSTRAVAAQSELERFGQSSWPHGAAGSAVADLLALQPYFIEASRRYALPVEFLRAVARVESNFNPRACSSKGALGMMQLMPRTARAMGVRDPYDARQSILGGARYLRVLANLWRGNVVLTVASYNAGPAPVKRCRCVPPYRETQGYVQRVLSHYAAYRQGLALRRR